MVIKKNHSYPGAVRGIFLWPTAIFVALAGYSTNNVATFETTKL